MPNSHSRKGAARANRPVAVYSVSWRTPLYPESLDHLVLAEDAEDAARIARKEVRRATGAQARLWEILKVS